MTLLKPHNIGSHLKGIETSFQVVPLSLKSFHFWVGYITFWNVLKIPGLKPQQILLSVGQSPFLFMTYEEQIWLL
jgi:hypothetical protein